jgi:predicted kinase
MNQPIFWMMIGLPCSGKSSYAKELAEEYDANIHSSDALREELTGDINNQNNNELVFKTLHQRIKNDLQNGKSCVYDACCIHYKERKAFLQELKNIPCEKICVLMATPYEVCLERSTTRDRKVSEYVIKRMYMSFDPPGDYEGWDDIQIIYSNGAEGSYNGVGDWVESAMDYDQHNSHHTLTLGEHCMKTFEYLSSVPVPFWEIRTAALIHDCGKVKSATYTNSKGEQTDECHYYNHQYCGSYDSLFFRDIDRHLYVAQLIRWHMQPYFWEKGNNEKLHNKYRKLWGEKLYTDIMTLHEADLKAH